MIVSVVILARYHYSSALLPFTCVTSKKMCKKVGGGGGERGAGAGAGQ